MSHKKVERIDPLTQALPCVGCDSHAHLDGEEFDADREEVLARARAAGVAVAFVGVVEEGRKAADDAAPIKLFGRADEGLGLHADGLRAANPRFADEFAGLETLFERQQNLPLLPTQLRSGRTLHDRRLVQLVAGFEAGASHMPDTQRKHADDGQRGKVFRTDELGQQAAVALNRTVACRNLERGPEAVVAAGGIGALGFAQHDVSGEGVVIAQAGVGRFEPRFGEFPSDEGAVGQAGGEQGLADAANGAARQHGAEAFDDEGLGQVAGFGDGEKGTGSKAVDAVFGYREDAAIDVIGAVAGNGCGRGVGGWGGLGCHQDSRLSLA